MSKSHSPKNKKNKALREALQNAILALDTWTHIHAPDMCDEKRVQEAGQRIMNNGGTLYYIATTVEQCRKARRLVK